MNSGLQEKETEAEAGGWLAESPPQQGLGAENSVQYSLFKHVLLLIPNGGQCGWKGGSS